MAWSLSTLKGHNAERQAEAFLRKKGFKLIDRNFKKTFGEVDLIMQDGNTLVFVEVRSRGSANLASPEETIDRNKQRRMIKVAEIYLKNYPLTPCRFDVVGIVGQEIYWIPNAFFANGY